MSVPRATQTIKAIPMPHWLGQMQAIAVLLWLLHQDLTLMTYGYRPQADGIQNNWQALTAFVHQVSQETHPLWGSLAYLGSFGFYGLDILILLYGFKWGYECSQQKMKRNCFWQRRFFELVVSYWISLGFISILWAALGALRPPPQPSVWELFEAAFLPFISYPQFQHWPLSAAVMGYVHLLLTFAVLTPWLWQLRQRWGPRNLVIVSLLITVLYRWVATYVFKGHPPFFATPETLDQPFLVLPAHLATFVFGLSLANSPFPAISRVRSFPQTLGLGLGLLILGLMAMFYRWGWSFASVSITVGFWIAIAPLLNLTAHNSRIAQISQWLGQHSYYAWLLSSMVISYTVTLVVDGNWQRNFILLPGMIVGIYFLAAVLQALQWQLHKLIYGLWRDIDYILKQPTATPTRTWTPAVGDQVIYRNERRWGIIQVERMLDEGETYLCRIAKDDKSLWVSEQELKFDRPLKLVWDETLTQAEQRWWNRKPRD